MKYLCLLVFVFCLNAVAAQSEPTPVDLKAAYCAAVIKAGLDEDIKLYNESSKVFSSESDAMVYQKKSIAAKKDKHEHLRGYLLTRMSGLDTHSIYAAMSRGTLDIQRTNSPEISSCTQNCTQTQRSENELSACIKACAPETFNRVWSCNELSWLPY